MINGSKILFLSLFIVVTLSRIVFAENYLPEIKNAINQDEKTVFVDFKSEYKKSFPEIIIKSASGYWVAYVYKGQIDSDKIELMDLDFYFRYINSFIFSNSGRTGLVTGDSFGINMNTLFGIYLECRLSEDAFSHYINDIFSDTRKIMANFATIPFKSQFTLKYRGDMVLYLKDILRCYELLHKQAIARNGSKDRSQLNPLFKEMPYLDKIDVKQNIERFLYNDTRCRYDYHIFITLENEVRNRYLADYQAKLKEFGIAEKPKEVGD